MGWKPPYDSWAQRTYSTEEEPAKHALLHEYATKWFDGLLSTKITPGFQELVPISENMGIQNFMNLFGCFVKRLDVLLVSAAQAEQQAAGGAPPAAEGGGLTPRQLEVFERMFAFCCVWSIGASCTDASRKIFNEKMHMIEGR